MDGNMPQDLPRLHETADNTKWQLIRRVKSTNVLWEAWVHG